MLAVGLAPRNPADGQRVSQAGQGPAPEGTLRNIGRTWVSPPPCPRPPGDGGQRAFSPGTASSLVFVWVAPGPQLTGHPDGRLPGLRELAFRRVDGQ